MRDASAAQVLPHELLHLVALAQEVCRAYSCNPVLWLTAFQAFLIFTIESTRFKAGAVVKQNKFGAVCA